MNKHKYLSILDQTMGLVNAIYLYMLVLFVLFKHWFLNLVDLFTGGPPLKDLNSEIVLITGAASGLGKGIAQRLAQLGCTLVLWDVDEKNNILVAEELNNTTNSKRIHAMKCDLTNRENIYQCAKKVLLFIFAYKIRSNFRFKKLSVM